MSTTAKPRITYIDVAKGILICCLLYGHIRFYGPMDGLQDDVMQYMSHTGPLYGFGTLLSIILFNHQTHLSAQESKLDCW